MTAEPIQREIEAFESMRADLEKHHMGKHVIVKDGKLVGAFDTFDAAESFIRGLPIKNCGYGFVIDLLPIIALTALSTPLSLSTATSPQTREHGLEREK